MRILLGLISLIVPRSERPRWREEWLAESRHGGWRMLAGALPDAWALRRMWRSAGRTSKRRPFHGLGQDLRYSIRSLAASPGFVLGVVLSLNIGLGANILAFSFINAAVFRPFPGVRNQHELVRLAVEARNARQQRVSVAAAAPDVRVDREFLERNFTTLSGVSAHHESSLAVALGNEAIAGPGALVSSNYFDTLGVRPAIGRFFLDDHDLPASDPVAVISHSAWQQHFRGDPAALGRIITVNGVAAQVIGVAAEGFSGVDRSVAKPIVWIPLGQAELVLRDGDGRSTGLDAASAYFDYIGRRQPGQTLTQVTAEADLLAAQLTRTARQDYSVDVSVRRVWLNDPAESAPAVAGFMVIPFLVLTIACVNAANLLVARAARNTRDWTVRLALGATRWRVIRPVLLDGLILSTASAALGLTLAHWTIAAVEARLPIPFPFDWRVALFTVTITVLAGVAFSLGPAFGVIAKAGVRSVANPSGVVVTRSRARFLLIAVQTACSLALLTTGAQFATKAMGASPDAAEIPAPERLVVASFDVNPLRMTEAETEDFYTRLLARAREIPGVVQVGLSTSGVVNSAVDRHAQLRIWTPMTPEVGSTGYNPVLVTPGALEAIGVPLIAGRHFTETDGLELRTVIVNDAFAQKFFEGPALGRTIRMTSASRPAARQELVIVGIAGGIMKRRDSEGPVLYHLNSARPLEARDLYLRLDETERFTGAALQRVVREVDPDVPVIRASTLQDIRTSRFSEGRLLGQAAAVLGLLALVLAAGGLYGVVSYVVSLRRREVGIRLALGAAPGALVRMITRQALTPTLIGAVIGLIASVITGLVVRSSYYGARPVDPTVWGSATLLLVVVLFGAAILPARRAATINPVETLRSE